MPKLGQYGYADQIGQYVCQNYTVQCRDETTGQIGDFLFDVTYWRVTGKFKAIGPVFDNLMDFYNWDKNNGNNHRHGYIRRISE